MAKRRKRGGGTAAAAASRAAPSAHSAPARKPWRGLDLALVVCAALGIALTAYLTYTAWFDDRPAFCGADSGCDLVQSSRWSTFVASATPWMETETRPACVMRVVRLSRTR